MSDLISDIFLVAFGAFLGALLGFIIPKFFIWKDEKRIELIENYTDLLKNCYGELRYVGMSINHVLKQQELNPIKKDLTTIKFQKDWVDTLRKVYGRFYHEFNYFHEPKGFLISYEQILQNINYSIITGYHTLRRKPLFELPYEEEEWWISIHFVPQLTHFFKEIEEIHHKLTKALNELRNLKSGIIKITIFYLPGKKMPRIGPTL